MGYAGHPQYNARSAADLVALLHAQPLAWLVSPGGDNPGFTPLPVRPVTDDDGQLHELRGHMAARNPHVQRLRQDPAALILAMGPQAYVSASWLNDRTQAPTWNYTGACFEVQIHLDDESRAISEELEALVLQMEHARDKSWRIAEMGERYAKLAAAVVTFRASIVAIHPRFKVGQDERDGDFADMLQGLQSCGQNDLVHWMQDFRQNPDKKGS